VNEYALALAGIADGKAILVEPGKVPVAVGKSPSSKDEDGTETVTEETDEVSTTTMSPKLKAEIDLVNKIAGLFKAQKRWSKAELDAKGVTPKEFKKPFIVAHLGSLHGLMITAKSKETVFIAVEIPGGAKALAEPAEPKHLLPSGTPFHWMPPEATKIRRSISHRRKILIVGPTGSGKTTLAEILIQEELGTEPMVMSLNGDMSKDDFWGSKELKDGSTYFRWGPAGDAMLRKIPLIINEVDMAAPEVLSCLQRALEGAPAYPKDVVCDGVNDEEGNPLHLKPWADEERSVKKADPEDSDKVVEVVETFESKFLVVATANILGRGDETGLYRGANILNESFLDRFDRVYFLGYPPPRYEAQILQKRTGINLEEAKKIVKVADLARKGFTDERKLNSTFSVRKTMNWALSIVDGDEAEDGFIDCVLNRVPEEDRIALAEMYQRVYGTTIDTKKLKH